MPSIRAMTEGCAQVWSKKRTETCDWLRPNSLYQLCSSFAPTQRRNEMREEKTSERLCRVAWREREGTLDAGGGGVVARVELRQVGDGLGNLLGRQLLQQRVDVLLI